MNAKIAAVIAVAILLVAAVAAAFVLSNNGDKSSDKMDYELVVLSDKNVNLPASAISTDLPASFDQRSQGIVTSVKNQAPWGTCWAFSGTSAAETSLVKMGYEPVDRIDLSEKHLAWFAKHPVTAEDELSQKGEGIFITEDTGEEVNICYNTPGGPMMFSYLYSCGIGPVSESDFPYMGKNGLTALGFFTLAEYKDKALEYLNEKFKEESLGMGFDSYYGIIKAAGTHAAQFDKWVEMGYAFPDGTTADNLTADAFFQGQLAYFASVYEKENEYSSQDDWSIPLSSKDGSNNRDLTMGYTLLNGNELPSMIVKDGKAYKGISKYALKMVKKEIYEGKGVAAGYNHSSDIYNAETASAYNPELKNTNHIIQIVGWDDGYSKDNFLSKPEGDGAWLVKNSWGSETDGYVVDGKTYYSGFGIVDDSGKHTGYFWLSYYDRSLGAFESLEFTDKISAEDGFETYMYDYMPGMLMLCYTSGKESKVANVFSAEGSEKITALSVKTCFAGSEASVSVYLLDDGFKSPEDGTKVATVSKTMESAGYHTIILDSPVALKAGQKFSIVMEEKNSLLEGGKTVYITGPNFGLTKKAAIENENTHYCVSVLNKGESYIFQGGSWSDWSEASKKMPSEDGIVADNFNLKAFTVSA